MFRCICMTPWILQALYECQGSAVLTHRSLRTQLRNQWEEAGVDLQEKRRGGSRLESIFPAVPPLPVCDGAVVIQPSPKTSVLQQGSSAASGVSR